MPSLALVGAGSLLAAVPTAVLAYAATHGWGPLRRLDQGTAHDLHSWALGTPGAVGALQVVSTVLHPWAVRAIAAVAAGGLVLRRQTRLALWVVTAVVGAEVVLGGALRERRRRRLAPGTGVAGGHRRGVRVVASGRPPHEPTEVVSEGLDPPGSHVAADKS